MLELRSGLVWNVKCASRIMKIIAPIKLVSELKIDFGDEFFWLNRVAHHFEDTYNAPYPDGTMAQGGYASHIRAHEYFTFRIPDNIPSAMAAPMLCAVITTYSPLVRAKCGPGKKVAVVGM